MPRIFPEYKRSTVVRPVIGAVFHVVIVVTSFCILSGGTGEAGKTVGWLETLLKFMFILFGSFFIFSFLLIFSFILKYFPQIGAPGTTNNFIFFSIVGHSFLHP